MIISQAVQYWTVIAERSV